MSITITEATALIEGQTEVKNASWEVLADLVTEKIAQRVGDIEMHHFEADLWTDDEGTDYFEWKAEVRLLHTE